MVNTIYKTQADAVFRLLRHFIYCLNNLPHNGIQRRYGQNMRAPEPYKGNKKADALCIGFNVLYT